MDDLTLGPRPVLLSIATPTPLLMREGGEDPIPVVRVEAFELVDFQESADVHAWRPVEPLEAGRYSFAGAIAPFAGATQTFFVDPEWVELEPVIDHADYHVTLDDPDEDEGISCAGDAASCFDVDFSNITVPSRTASAHYPHP